MTLTAEASEKTPSPRQPGDPNPPEIKEAVNRDLVQQIIDAGLVWPANFFFHSAPWFVPCHNVLYGTSTVLQYEPLQLLGIR